MTDSPQNDNGPWALTGRRPLALGLGGAVFVGICFFTFGGCSGCNQGTKPNKIDAEPDYLAVARAIFGKATEAAAFRDADEQVNKYLEKHAEVLAKHQPGNQDATALKAILTARGIDVSKLDDASLYSKFLESVVGLDRAEIEEVEGSSFRMLDTHYLEGCVFLRTLARSLPDALTPLEQATYCFRWVGREVVLQEPRQELLPPDFVLKRGEGSASERAVVFLWILRQINLDGCILALPDKDGKPQPRLVGVLVPEKDTNELYLFDFRLGLPLPGPKGEGIATFTQLKADPHLLDQFKPSGDAPEYDLTADDVPKLKMLVAAPLSALSARMRFLETDVLADFNRIAVAVRLPELIEKFEKLKAGPVGVWNQPTAALRTLLPPEEGGVDTSKIGPGKLNRWQEFQSRQRPEAAVVLGLMEEKALFTEVPAAGQTVEQLWPAVWNIFAVEPAQQLIRGKNVARRLARAQRILELADAQDSQAREREIEALHKNPGQLAKFQEQAAQDAILIAILKQPDDDLPNQPMGLACYIVLQALSKPLQEETNYLQALRAQDDAAKTQTRLDGLKNAREAEKAKVLRESRDAWESAVSYGDYLAAQGVLSADVFEMAITKAQELEKMALGVDYLERHLRLVRRVAAMRLLQAQALLKIGKKNEAEGVLNKLRSDLDTLQRHEKWDTLRASLVRAAMPARQDAITAAVNRMLAERGSGGSLAWFRLTANRLLPEHPR
jgi:hypothetical protein